MTTISPYDDLLHLPHPVSPTRPHLSALDRAAQFSAFAALTGLDDAMHETARLTHSRIEPDETIYEELNRTLQQLLQHLAERPQISVTYFCPDAKKSGGAYRTTIGILRKLDAIARLLCLENGTCIPLDDVLTLNIL